jgi:chromosome segregation ATPase
MENLVSKSIENKAEVDRLEAKTEKFYMEIGDKLREFSKLKTDTEKIDDLTKEMIKSIDEINIKMTGFAKKEYVEDFKNIINDLVVSNKEKIEEKLKGIEESLNVPTEGLTSKISELQKKRESVLNLINSLEEQYRRGALKRETFEEVRNKNEDLLKKIDDDIKKLEGQKGLSLKSLPSIINELGDNQRMLDSKVTEMEEQAEPFKNLESRTYVMESSVDEIKEDLRKVGPEKMARMANAIEIQTEIVNDILTKLKEVNRRLMDAKVNLNDYENRTRFFEILNILVRLRAVNEISDYLNELENLILKMKLDKLWNREKQDLTENLLMELSENWHESGRDDVSKVFTDFLEKVRAPKTAR